jgi:hypothetical protein
VILEPASACPTSDQTSFMSFIDPENSEAIASLRRNQFALLRPERLEQAAGLLADTPRLRKTIQTMLTLLKNQGLGNVSRALGSHGSLPERMEALHQEILREMRLFLEKRDPGLLPAIFHRVQLWGGKMGKTIYVKGGGFSANFDSEAYQTFAFAAAGNMDLPGRVDALWKSADRIRFFGVSFATKHARFWAESAGGGPLPIYDSIMARGCYGRSQPHWKEYEEFVRDLARHAQELDVPVQTLERYAFTFFGAEKGRLWIDQRMSR